MALIKCVDCGNMISDSSEICIHCGCPTKKSIPELRDFVIEKGVLKKYNGKDRNIVIPEGVETITERAFRKGGLYFKITFPKSLRKIHNFAFLDCMFGRVELPEGTEELRYGVFQRCKRLKEVVLPSTLKEIKGGAFTYCEQLEKVVIKCSLGENFSEIFDKGREFEKTVFDLRKNPISILDTFQRKALSVACFLENIEKGIEYDEKIIKTNLAFIKKRSSDLAKYAMNSLALMKYMVKERLLPLDDAIVLSSNIDIDNEIKTILLDYIGSFGTAQKTILDSSALADKNSDYWLNKIWSYKKVKDTATLTFLKEESEVVIVPEQIDGLKVTALAPRCFENRKSVKEILISNTVIKLGEDLFKGCNALEKVVIGEGITEIKRRIFCETPIKEIILPQTIKRIVAKAFYGCKKLVKINLPDGLGIIEFGAGIYNTQAEYVHSNMRILEEAPKNAYTVDNGTNYIKTKENPYYYLKRASNSDDDFTINPKCKVILSNSFYCFNNNTLLIPNGIERIDARAFFKCGGLKKVIIGDKVKNISRNMFAAGKKVIIVGKIGSEAEAYAKEVGLTFEPID